ncbi:MAG: hypothetical protein ACXWTH_05375 [Methylosarcina sp.]
MSIKHRLAKLEQRIDKGLTIEQVYDRLRELLGKGFGIDLSHCGSDELMEYADEYLRHYIIKETGQQCHEWPHYRLLSEYGRLVRGMTA